MVLDGLRMCLAPNPGPMTARGTVTYLLGGRDIAVIDPGPADAGHLEAILGVVPAGGRISAILVTHTHRDHSALAPDLAARTGAPVYGFGDARAGRSAAMEALAGRLKLGGGEGVDTGFQPDRPLLHGERLSGEGWTLEALHTPGHMSNHICLAWPEGGAIFTGDHVMGWASTFVSPPDGDMAAYLHSLDLLLTRAEQFYLPAHGEPITDGPARVRELIAHRRMREDMILQALANGPADLAALTAEVYADTPAAMHPAAARNLLAHLLKLMDEGHVTCAGGDLLRDSFARTT